jgi:hypothetical protein
VSAGDKAGAVNDLSTTGSVSMAAIPGADVDNGPGANSQRGDLVLERNSSSALRERARWTRSIC